MAKVTNELKEYLSVIDLSSAKREALRTSREAMADKIKNYFQNKGLRCPVFRQQGSFDMGTIIQPLSGEYDLDYGIYLQGFPQEESSWPTANTVHKWIIEAVEKHTQTPPVNKKTCVRVIFKGQYHIDLPSYIENESVCKLSHLEKGWIQSQPKDITYWFNEEINKNGNMLRDVVKILKGWADYQSTMRGKMPSGLILTVLAAENFVSQEKLDDCVVSTVDAILCKIKNSVEVYNPTDANEKLSDRLSSVVKERFREALKHLADSLHSAVAEDSIAKSSQIWRSEFGERFPVSSDTEEEYKKDIENLANRYSPKSTIKPWGYSL